MRYRKQSDGRSWLVYTKDEQRERKLALVRVSSDKPPFTIAIEMIEAQPSEMPEVELLAEKIRRRFSESALKICIACSNPLIHGYVSALAKACGARDKILFQRYDGRSSEEMFEEMAKEMYWQDITQEREFSEVWLVADRESWPLSVFDKGLRAKFPGIHFAFTHPSFEYWLLLHDSDFDGKLPFDKEEIVSAEQTEERLGRGRVRQTIVCEVLRSTSASACRKIFEERMPSYAKNPECPPGGFLERLGVALCRAKADDPESADWLSQMPQLFEKLCKLGRRRAEDVLAELEVKESDTSESAAPQATAPTITEPVAKLTPTGTPDENKEVSDRADDSLSNAEETLKISMLESSEEVFSELFHLTGKWRKNLGSLTGEDVARGRQLLESMQQWGERVYRTFGRGMPMFGNEIIRDMEVLRKEGEEKAEECLTVHIEKLRCKLGSLVKGNLQHTQNSMLTLLAEIRLCLIGFERFSGQKFRTGEGASVSEEGKANAAVSADAGGSDLAKMPCTPREEALLTGLSPKPDPASEEAAHRAVVRLTEALKPYTTKKNFRLNQVRSEQAEADIDTVFEWAYRLLLRKAERPYVRSQACQAEIDRIGRYECSMTREVFVKACQSVIGALGNVGSFWGETAEGTLMTLMDRLEIIKEWLALDCAEPF